MKKIRIPSIFLLLLLAIFVCSCTKQDKMEGKDLPEPGQRSVASIGITGDKNDVTTETQSGLVLMGGSTDVDAAIRWMVEQSGGGDFVVIRASGTDAYNPYIYGLGAINSVETLKINSVSLANDSAVVETIRNAEALFIAGGDQSDYVRYWKDTGVEDAVNYLINSKKVPVGGTSAGCAILGEISFSALNGTITSEEALDNPFHANITLQKGNFIDVPLLRNTITDQHYLARNREGRHITFMARVVNEIDSGVRGIGVDEKTAVVIDASGKARIFGESSAIFLTQTNATGVPEILEVDTPLTWNHDQKAVTAYRMNKREDGKPQFDLISWSPINVAESLFYYVEKGKLKVLRP